MANFDSDATYDSAVSYDEPESPAPDPMNTNRISATLTAQALTNIQTAVATIRQNLPFFVHLTPEERHDLFKLGPGREAALQLALVFAAQHPEALGATFDATEFAKDGTLYAPYKTVVALIAQLHEDCQDTDLALGTDLSTEMLDVYAFAKAANRDGRYDTFCQGFKAAYARKAPKASPAPAKPA
jgi:hypothetical protein